MNGQLLSDRYNAAKQKAEADAAKQKAEQEAIRAQLETDCRENPYWGTPGLVDEAEYANLPESWVSTAQHWNENACWEFQ